MISLRSAFGSGPGDVNPGYQPSNEMTVEKFTDTRRRARYPSYENNSINQ